MRVFFSGNEELARYHLPIVQSVANSFAERCKKAGLSQNAMAFSFNDTGAHASIQYVFGQLDVQISAPFTISEGGTITETLKSKSAIWIRTFDESVRYSYNGMFFSYWASLEPVYEPSELVVVAVEDKQVSDGARIVSTWEKRDTILFKHYTHPYGINAAFAQCSYEQADNGDPYSTSRIITQEIVVDGDSYGYPACAFYVPKANEMRWQAGGDAVFKDEIPVVAGQKNIIWFESFLHATGGEQYPLVRNWFVHPIGPTWAAFKNKFVGLISSICGCDGEAVFASHFGSSEMPVATRDVQLSTEFVVAYYQGINNTSVSCDGIPWDGICVNPPLISRTYYIDINVGPGIDLVIDMIDVDGSFVSQTVDPSYFTVGQETYIYPPSFTCSYPYIITFNVYLGGVAVPTGFSGAPRGYLHAYFCSVSVARAIAYSKQTGWKKCIPIPGYAMAYTRIMWIGPYAEVCIKYNIFSSNLILDYLKKTFNSAQDNFSYNSLLTIGMSGTTQSVVIFSENGRYVSLYNCQTYPNGIYDIITGNFNQVHLYDDTEIEPIFMDEVAGVICTKRAIYLDHGARSLLCTECCGMFLDHTHYVDKLADGSFVLNKIVEGDNGLVGVMVDSLPVGAYNFYEFSEDASVCIISNYYMYPEDPQPSSPAIVLDYADPVYRFEPSDQTIIQYMRPDIFEPTEENRRLGYPTGIPFGARYVNICACYPAGVPKREHFVYCRPKNGVTTTEATIDARGDSSFCPLQSGERIRYRDKFPTIVPQYSTAAVNRRDHRYDGKRLNRHIYHHTGKILRRISEKLEPIDVELETTITRKV